MQTLDPVALPSGHQYLPTTSTSPNQAILPLTAKVNSRDCLEIGGCDVTTLVKRFGSPLYILDEATLRQACRDYRDSFAKYYPGESLVIYASKAWSCQAICLVVASEGLGFDVVSGGEIYTTLTALNQSMGTIDLTKIYFHGNNKSPDELKLAINNKITIIVDNWLELETIVAIAANEEQPVRIMLRITPGIECHTHDYIRTGHLDSKFGFDPNELESLFSYVSQQEKLNCIGLHAHIGSQIFEQQPHQDLAGVLVEWMKKAEQVYGLAFTQLNLGGGLGIRYTEKDDPQSIEQWVKGVAQAVVAACEKHNLPLPKLITEPGRSLIGNACVTAYTVGSRKVVPGIRTYIAVDGGMSDNPRPITYQSLYRAVIANRMSAPLQQKVTVAGKHCESGDILIKDALLSETKSGDILVVMGTGAYNSSMASNYNRIGRPAAVIVNEGEANLILMRETYSDLIRQDRLPERLLLQSTNK